MTTISLENPVFAAYTVAAALMCLKVIGMSWLTVVRMVQVNGGYRSPEDTRKTLLNPNPDPGQVAPNDYVDRIRRIQLNDLENIPFFLVLGLLYTLTDPNVWLARGLFYGYALTRLLHFLAYVTGQTHDVRASLWTPGSMILIFLAVRVLAAAALGI